MAKTVQLSESEKESAIDSFQQFLRFQTVSATSIESGEYVKAANWLVNYLSTINNLRVHLLDEAPPHSPVVVACLEGVDTSLPIILLNSHYDVVPASAQDWTVEPFEGLRKDNKIYGRGAQDMKCVCIQYVEAIRFITTHNPDYKPQRSIYLTFVPDEEVGGAGMASLIQSTLYKNLPGIALALDEGLASEDDTYSVFYGERMPWWVGITAHGSTGHGSRFIDNTAVEQLIQFANKALEFRQNQKDILFGHGNKHAVGCAHSVAAAKSSRRNDQNKLNHHDNSLDGNSNNNSHSSNGQKKNKKLMLGDVTTLNITTLQAGVQVADTYAYNCCPPVAKCSLDIRISPHMDPKQMKELLNGWCKECSPQNVIGVNNDNVKVGLEWDFINGQNGDAVVDKHCLTSTDPQINPWFNIFASAMKDMGLSIEPQVFPAATDSRFLRALGVRALGFSPRNSEILLHENDEYLLEDVFIEGIEVYVGLIQQLANQGRGDIDDDQHNHHQLVD